MREMMVVEGGDALRDRLKALGKGIDVDLAEGAMLEAADPMRQRVVELAPRSAGAGHAGGGLHLADDINLAVGRQEPGAATVMLRIAKAFYWRFVEFGTRRLSAHPFIRPGYDAEKDATVTRFGARLTREIDRYSESP